MPEITLTTFVDFVVKSGTPKLTCVRRAKDLYRQDYEPAFDFWKPLREAIVRMHKDGASKKALDAVLLGLSDKNKRKLYPQRIASYKKWLGRKSVEWVGCEMRLWKHATLVVRVNPELAVRINGEPYLIKLYFKQDPLSKTRVDAILHLIRDVFSEGYADFVPAVLDVARSKLHEPTKPIPAIDVLLRGEAAAFVTMWNSV